MVLVSAGLPVHSSGGKISSPTHVNMIGIESPSANPELVTCILVSTSCSNLNPLSSHAIRAKKHAATAVKGSVPKGDNLSRYFDSYLHTCDGATLVRSLGDASS